MHNANGTFLIPLFQLLTENFAKDDLDLFFENVSFVVFNYDRCIEYFLPLAIEKYYGVSQDRAQEVCSTATIIHPYGRVGELGQGKSLSSARFGAERYNLLNIAEGIRTFSEGLADESHAEQISGLMHDADQLVFLGFAFHPLNMEILEFESKSFLTKIFGTTYGLSDPAMRAVERSILSTTKSIRPSRSDLDSLQELNLEPSSAVDFLHSHFRGIAEH